MKYDLVIWDFNGTLCDDVQIGIDCINVVLARRNMPLVTDKAYYRKCFCFPIKTYYERLGFDFEIEPYDVPALEWTAEYLKRESTITENEGVSETLAKIKEMGLSQIILSSSEITMLERELDILNIRHFFEAALGLDNTFAGGKTEMARQWAKGRTYKALFVGDSVHDYDTACAIGADCVLFSGGHDSLEHLTALPCPVVDRIGDVLNYLD